MSAEGFEQLASVVLGDPRLVAELVVLVDDDAFTSALVRTAGRLGLDVDAADVVEAMQAGHRRGLERFV